MHLTNGEPQEKDCLFDFFFRQTWNVIIICRSDSAIKMPAAMVAAL